MASTPRGVFVQHYDTDALDASVLLMGLVRFLPADDERPHATVLAIADEPEELEARSGRHLGELPPGLHAPRADQRGHARDRRPGARGR